MSATNFGCLQLNDLAEFFRRIPSEELLVYKKVSKLWAGVIDHFVGVEIFAGEYNQYIWELSEENEKDFGDIGQIKKHGVRDLYFSFSSSYEKNDDDLEFKNPKVLKKLWIDGYPPEPYLAALFNQCPNVKDLSIHLWSSALRFNSSALNFPFLQKLTISMYGVDEKESHIRRNGERAEIVIDFLRRVNTLSHCLKEIALQVPMDVRKSLLIAVILQFIIRHKDSLEKVKLQLEKGETHDASNEQIELFDAESLPIIQQIFMDFEEMPDLKECFLHCKAIARNHRPVAQLMEFFNKAKPSLTKLHLSLGYQRLPETLILNSAETLKFVELAITTRHHTQPVNLAPFEQCKNLTNLKLMGPTVGIEEEVEQLLPDLRNLNALPSGLLELCLMNLRIRKEDGNHISRLENLNQLVLSEIGTVEHYGLLVEDAIRVIANPKLHWIKLTNAVNKGSFSNQEFWQAHPELDLPRHLLSKSIEEEFFLIFDEKYIPKDTKERPDPLKFTLENGILGENDEDEGEDEYGFDDDEEDGENNLEEELDEEEDEEMEEEEYDEMEEDEEIDEEDEEEELDEEDEEELDEEDQDVELDEEDQEELDEEAQEEELDEEELDEEDQEEELDEENQEELDEEDQEEELDEENQEELDEEDQEEELDEENQEEELDEDEEEPEDDPADDDSDGNDDSD